MKIKLQSTTSDLDHLAGIIEGRTDRAGMVKVSYLWKCASRSILKSRSANLMQWNGLNRTGNACLSAAISPSGRRPDLMSVSSRWMAHLFEFLAP